jgi:hypothetical protein
VQLVQDVHNVPPVDHVVVLDVLPQVALEGGTVAHLALYGGVTVVLIFQWLQWNSLNTLGYSHLVLSVSTWF